MLTPLLAVYIVIAVSLVILGMLVLLKNSKIATNRLFSYFVFSLALWLLANYFSNEFSLEYHQAVVANHLALFFSGLALISVFRFSALIAKNSYLTKRSYFFILAAIANISAVTPWAIESIERQDHVYAINFGSIAYIYFATLAISAVGTFIVLFHGLKKADSQDKTRITIFIWSLIATVAVNMVTNFIIPVATGSFTLTNLGPLSTLVMVAGLYYGIVRHKLFDIRLIVARSLAYLLLLSTLVGLYGIIVFGATNRLFGNTVFAERIVPILTALLLAFTSPYFRKLFDKVTNKLFYRDAYDSQVFLNDVNKLLVGQINLEQLLKGITTIIEQNLKTSYCVFIIRETAYEKARIVGTDDHKFKDEKIKQLRELAPHAHRKVLITDELVEYKDQLEGLLKELDISVLTRLVSNASQDLEGMGYLVLGPKKNGTIYSSQDKQVLDILANEMVIAVENALRYEEIQKFADTLQAKVDEQTKTLRKTNEKLKQMDETKDEFISMASHQLRTPLTSVKGYLSMVLEGDVGQIPEMQRKLLDQAFVSSQRMVYLIADLLNVSRLRTGKFIIEQIPTNLASVVEEESGQLKETAKARKLELTYNKPENFPEIPLDETKIRQVVMNFMDNAIYYTPAGGHINVEVKDTGKAIEYTVTDDGLGVPKWDQAHLFTKFYRAGNAKKARPDGTGLGLFMAKKVVAAQGGSIIFKSEEGKGSTFGFSFDKEKLQKMADDQAKKDEVTHPKPTEVAAKVKAQETELAANENK